MRTLSIILLLLVTGCSTTGHAPEHSNTMDIIAAAAQAAPEGVLGDYVLNIKATGSKRRIVYLNTELDYRDQRCVTVALEPQVVAELEAKFAQSPESLFIGRSVRVKGEAIRATIDFTYSGQRSGKYYFQTHIWVSDTAQIALLPPAPKN